MNNILAFALLLCLSGTQASIVDNTCVCGRVRTNRVVGGQEAGVNEWPWQAALVMNIPTQPVFQFCGGSLISNQDVVTAAHCVNGASIGAFEVWLSEHDLNSETESTTIVRQVREIKIHENYNGTTYENDIAILRLHEPVDFSSSLLPACLPPKNFRKGYAGQTAYVTGWGATSQDGNSSSVLMEADVEVMSHRNCKKAYSSLPNVKFTKSMICAKNPGKDSCRGDDGGPLVFKDRLNRYDMIGVFSWSYGCANPDYPGVYTRVSKFRSWILEETSDSTFCKAYAAST